MSHRLLHLILASAAFSFGLAAASSYAAGLGGTLQGSVTQDQPNSTYAVEIELYGDKGSVNYSSLGCGGRLDLLRSNGGAYSYKESLQFGKDKCIDGGTIELSPHPIDKAAWNYRWQGSGVTVRGVLHGSAMPDTR